MPFGKQPYIWWIVTVGIGKYTTAILMLVFNSVDSWAVFSVGHETENWSIFRRYMEFYVLENKLTEFHGKMSLILSHTFQQRKYTFLALFQSCGWWMQTELFFIFDTVNVTSKLTLFTFAQAHLQMHSFPRKELLDQRTMSSCHPKGKNLRNICR